MNLQQRLHDILNSPISPFTELLREVELVERDNDEEFRKVIEKLYQYILNVVRTSPGPEYKISHALTLKLKPNDKPVGATYNHVTNTITMNTNLDNELFQTSPEKFVEKYKMQLFHELVHFVDYSRGSIYRAHQTTTGIETPAEWNSYFHTFVKIFEEHYSKLRNNGIQIQDAFDKTYGETVNGFICKFWDFVKNLGEKENIDYTKEINDSGLKFKWNKRLYQTYFDKRKKY